MVKEILGAVVAPVASIFNKRTERKILKDEIRGAIAKGKQEGETQAHLSDKAWELVSKQNEDDSWKDEYLTIVITSPIVLLLLGGVVAAFTGDTRLLTGTTGGISAIAQLGVDMGELMYVVVLAGVSIKAIKQV